MSVMRSKDGDNLVVDCKCGCDYGIRIRVDKEDEDMYFFLSYMSGNFYSEQGDKLWCVIWNNRFTEKTSTNNLEKYLDINIKIWYNFDIN